MKKNFIKLFLIFMMTFTLCACGEIVEEPPIKLPDNPTNQPINGSGNGNEKEVEFSVSLIINKEVYVPIDGEIINVYWRDDVSEYHEPIDSTGFAKKKLDGDFNVYLDNVPEGYTYNPNIYTASTDSPKVEIELLKISRVRGKGTGLYECYKVSTGTFRAELKKANQKVFYEFHPTQNGYYFIESIVNIFDDTINPIIDTYTGTVAAKYGPKTIDAGGISTKDGFTRNFRWTVKLTEEEVGSCFTFSVYADSATGTLPINVDFQITYVGENLSNPTIPTFKQAQEANFKTPDYSSDEYTYINSNGGEGSYYTGALNGSTLIDGSIFRYNEETGYYHYYDKTNKTYGPILCAKITKPCAYYELPFSEIEYQGNSALTVSNGTENYKQFIEIEYAACCNTDGVCYVTKELKEFLQKFSISQRLFMDGDGFVEYTGVYASEEDQWLFACGYYKEN